VTATVRRPRSAPGPTLPRLLAASPDLGTHVARYGPLPSTSSSLLSSLEQAGLRGRGGAGFPTARKIVAVAATGRGTVAVANGTEGEPLSAKDKVLLTRAPQLVLDGLALAADMVGARRRILCIERGNRVVEEAVRQALSERREDRVELFTTPRRYLSGQENALVDLINGGQGKPTMGRPFVRGVNGRPTLVDNVETLAHLALIARYGPEWYREVGTPEDPGSTLVTVAGSVGRPGVYEVAHGWRLDEVLAHAGATRPRAVLLGGYYGRWVGTENIRGLRVNSASLGAEGLSLGCGVIAVLDDTTCAVAETARVSTWFAANSAGQCGACTWGLRDLAYSASGLSEGRPEPAELGKLMRWANMIEGRGACGLPDGAVLFLRTALQVFADEVHDHLGRGCSRTRRHVLPTPTPEPWERTHT
jgi:NADH:ubiquinone oxidoreductase subunit F (NADH-binding)